MGDISTPTRLSLLSAEATPQRVRLTWYAAGSAAPTATVYRRTTQSEWGAIGRVAAADGTDRLVYEDAGVVPGTRYGYRLGVIDSGSETFMGEAWVDVPAAVAFGLAGLRPNPAPGNLSVAFSLPDGAPARLEILDLAGRHLMVREVGGLGAGNHLVRMDRAPGMGPGVYYVRLVRGAQTVTTRGVVLR